MDGYIAIFSTSEYSDYAQWQQVKVYFGLLHKYLCNIHACTYVCVCTFLQKVFGIYCQMMDTTYPPSYMGGLRNGVRLCKRVEENALMYTGIKNSFKKCRGM